MSDMILHHYELSPYSEKLRAMFGYLDMSWQSVITEPMPPRKKLYPLAGGYRKIPVAQIGADVYCDTRTITEQIAAMNQKPELFIHSCKADVKQIIDEVEGEFFFASVMYSSSSKLNKKVLQNMSVFGLIKLFIDRINMSRKANIKMVTPGKAGPIVKEFLPRFEAMLNSDFLFGDQPNIADFSAYHSLWFIHVLGEKPIMNQYPKTVAWLERIKNFGHGVRKEISADEALSIARSQQPKPISEDHQQHDLIDELVDIAPDDYGLTPSTGVLKGCTDTSYIIARESKQTGLVHVHFPKTGFAITPSR